jgi:nitrous oxidase accessory protein NosD
MWRKTHPAWGQVGAIAVALLIVGTSLVVLPASSDGSGLAIQHDPIFISGDQEFIAENGVTGGSGTSSDPYTIEGWDIGPNEAFTSIVIVNTRSYFIVRDVHLFTASVGISLTNVTHALIESSVFFNMTLGVSMYKCDSCKVTLSTFELNRIGIVFSYSDATQSKNTFINCTENVKRVETELPLMNTWVGTAVCVATLIPLSIFIGLLLYYRSRSGKMKREYPPVQ